MASVRYFGYHIIYNVFLKAALLHCIALYCIAIGYFLECMLLHMHTYKHSLLVLLLGIYGLLLVFLHAVSCWVVGTQLLRRSTRLHSSASRSTSPLTVAIATSPPPPSRPRPRDTAHRRDILSININLFLPPASRGLRLPYNTASCVLIHDTATLVLYRVTELA